jgi:hypothetical protein
MLAYSRKTEAAFCVFMTSWERKYRDYPHWSGPAIAQLPYCRKLGVFQPVAAVITVAAQMTAHGKPLTPTGVKQIHRSHN